MLKCTDTMKRADSGKQRERNSVVMYEGFTFQDITYQTEAPGWIKEVYYPRVPEVKKGSAFLEQQGEIYKLHSRVWQEIEETGYGVYYYEETTQFAAEFDGCNYVVKVVLVNPTDEPYSCHVRLNRVVKHEAVTLKPGEEKELTFVACMTTGKFELSIPVGNVPEIKGDVIEGDVYIKDITVEPEAAKEKRKKPHVFLISDSTVQSYDKRFYPQTGWGQVFYQYFKGAEEYQVYRSENAQYGLAKTYETETIAIENRSIGGRSARSFYEEGKLDQALEVICPGDFMFVQFAHNDNSNIRPNRYISTEDYPAWLQVYIEACKRRGVQCVLVTAVTMRIFDEEGKFKIAFNNYREKMIETAKAQNMPLLDLGLRSTEYLNEIGEPESKNIYLWAAEGEYPDGAFAAGVSDNAHLQEYGAKIFANIVAKMIAEYDVDDRLEVLKDLVVPKEFAEIERPEKKAVLSGGEATRNAVADADGVSGFVLLEISVENGRGNFLLNWNEVKDAVSYHVYAKKKEASAFALVRDVTVQEKNAMATMPFSAEAGFVWEYYVAAVFAGGNEGHASRMIEVDLT